MFLLLRCTCSICRLKRARCRLFSSRERSFRQIQKRLPQGFLQCFRCLQELFHLFLPHSLPGRLPESFHLLFSAALLRLPVRNFRSARSRNCACFRCFHSAKRQIQAEGSPFFHRQIRCTILPQHRIFSSRDMQRKRFLKRQVWVLFQV